MNCYIELTKFENEVFDLVYATDVEHRGGRRGGQEAARMWQYVAEGLAVLKPAKSS